MNGVRVDGEASPAFSGHRDDAVASWCSAGAFLPNEDFLRNYPQDLYIHRVVNVAVGELRTPPVRTARIRARPNGGRRRRRPPGASSSVALLGSGAHAGLLPRNYLRFPFARRAAGPFIALSTTQRHIRRRAVEPPVVVEALGRSRSDAPDAASCAFKTWNSGITKCWPQPAERRAPAKQVVERGLLLRARAVRDQPGAL